MIYTKECKIVGYQLVDFTGKDGKAVSGYTVFVSWPISPSKGQGHGFAKVYVSARNWDERAYNVGMDCTVAYVNGKYELCA